MSDFNRKVVDGKALDPGAGVTPHRHRRRAPTASRPHPRSSVHRGKLRSSSWSGRARGPDDDGAVGGGDAAGASAEARRGLHLSWARSGLGERHQRLIRRYSRPDRVPGGAKVDSRRSRPERSGPCSEGNALLALLGATMRRLEPTSLALGIEEEHVALPTGLGAGSVENRPAVHLRRHPERDRLGSSP